MLYLCHRQQFKLYVPVFERNAIPTAINHTSHTLTHNTTMEQTVLYVRPWRSLDAQFGQQTVMAAHVLSFCNQCHKTFYDIRRNYSAIISRY